jgi:hypothetical protein
VLQSAGQIVQTERLELPFSYTEENYLMTSAGGKGLILFRESKKRVNKKRPWEILIVDTSLNEKLNVTAEVSNKYTIMGYEYREGYFYLLFNNSSSSKSDLYLVKVSVEDGSITDHEIDNELTMEPSHLLINDRAIVLGGYISYRPTFMVFDYINKNVKVVPGFFNRQSEVLDFNYDEKHDSYNVLMGQKNAVNHNELAIKSFDSNGKVLVDEKYEFDDNLRALNGKVIISKSNKIVVSGSFATNNSYYSQGYYFGNITPGTALSMKYIGFTEVSHFFDYMKPKRAEKIKTKINKSKTSSSPYEFKTQAYVHGLSEGDGEFLLISELYKPEFSNANSSVGSELMDDNRRTYRNNTGQKYVNRYSRLTNTQGASHISYHESVVLALDESGRLIWDQSIPLEEKETLALEQVAEVYKKDENGVLIYKKDGDLVYKAFDLAQENSADSTVAINTFKENDEVVYHSERQGRVQYWYENNFIVWGYQKVNNDQFAEADKKRNIFFINKLLIE